MNPTPISGEPGSRLPNPIRLGVVVPAYNESVGLLAFHARLRPVLDQLGMAAQVLYVDDGSRDDTFEVIRALRASDPRVSGLRLSRNCGKEIALTAGLDQIDADAVVVIDADLQDPPELIPELVAQWRHGFDVVYATRTSRAGESALKKATSAVFYRVIGRMSDTPIPQDTGDFRLLGRSAVDALRRMRERNRFMKGLFSWIGFRQTSVRYDRDARHAGGSKWNYWRLWNFALDGITSFSTLPLRLASYVGLLTAVGAFLFGLWVLVKAALFGDPVKGYPSLMLVMLMLGGTQLLALGIIGEYLGRLFIEAKQRPLYFVGERIASAPAAEAGVARASSDEDGYIGVSDRAA